MGGFTVEPEVLRTAADAVDGAYAEVRASLGTGVTGTDVGHAGLAAAIGQLVQRSDVAVGAGVASATLMATSLRSTASHYAGGDAQTAHTFSGPEGVRGQEHEQAWGDAVEEESGTGTETGPGGADVDDYAGVESGETGGNGGNGGTDGGSNGG